MKKLARIKLINWHLFSNQTVDINNNSLLSGENGAGKSTFLDALQYVLTGGKAKFNTAANSLARRDLEGYLRCKLGIENKTYLRNNDVISHIALEFIDETSFLPVILGAIMEINKSGRIYERFYVLKNHKISDDLFIEDNIIRGYATFKKHLLSIEQDTMFCDTKEKTRKMFLNELEIKNDKYIELIPKALAFRPIDELNKFVFDFLLNEKNVSIDDLRQNVRSYREFESLIEDLTQKESILTSIETLSKQYNQYEETKESLAQLKEYCQFQQLVTKEKNLNTEIKELELSINKIKLDELKIEQKLNSIQDEIDSMNNVLNRNESFQYHNDLERKIKEKEIDKSKLLNVVNDMCTMICNEENLSKYVYQHLKKEEILLKQINLKQPLNEMIISKHLSEVKKIYDSIKESLLIELNDLKKEKIQLNSELEKINNEIFYLEKNQIKFDERVERLKELIKNELNKSNVYALCELIEVNDETWRNALEGYLNTQRFDLIVDSNDFDHSLKVYEKNKFKEKISGVGLVNTSKLIHYKETNINSLASKIHTRNQNARNYINMLLNKVICCENVEELKNYKTSITKTCMVYKNYTARQISANHKPYIGINAIKLQLENAKMIKKNLENKRIDCSKKISLNEFYIERVKASQIDYIIQNIHFIKEFNEINEEINSLKEKEKLVKFNKETSQLFEEIIEMKEMYKKIDMKKNECFMQEGRLSSELENKKNQLSNIKENKLKYKLDIENIIIDYYQDLLKAHEGNLFKVLNYCERDIEKNEDNLKNSRIEIITKMNQFNLKYHAGFSPTISNLQSYIDELNKIRDFELIKYSEKAKEARINCEIAFKEQFIYKLRENIINAHEELDHLNQALKGKRFGGDEYEFIYQKSPHPDYERYYSLIMNNEDYNLNSLFTETVSDHNKLVLKELFDKLVIDGDDQIKETNLREFCDYRNYMSYDIKIHHHNGETTYFSKVSREKSGGETQTPFYVVIAASFEQIIADKNKRYSPACFVMFDEAFNNMDESRIQAMMEFYNQLNIQLMIAVPPQRIDTIIKYVHTTLVVMKDSEQSFIESFTNNK